MKSFNCEQAETVIGFLIDGEKVSEPLQKSLDRHLETCASCREKMDRWKTVDRTIRHSLQEEDKKHPPFETIVSLSESRIKSGPDLENLQHHLDQCLRCRKILRDLETVNLQEHRFQFGRMQRKLAFVHLAEQFMQGFLRPGRSTGLRLAMAACMLILCLVVLDRHRPAVQIQPEPEITTEPVKETDPKNFETAPFLEGMLAFHARASGIEVLTPNNGQIFKDTVPFSWKSDETGHLILILLDNHGREIKRLEVTGNRYELKEPLRPGLYYWKLESETDLLFLGKFIIR
ncbi:zf-HC2 domain-containing protein [bacterium]|nr:zf-HC2 domain-containing protein [bacterium]